MSIVDFLKIQYPNKTIENALLDYVIDKDAMLESDVQERLGGIKASINKGLKFAGYNILRDFVDGDQWRYYKGANQTMSVFNFCSTVVWNNTAFLTNEMPEVDISPTDRTDSIQVAVAEAMENIVDNVLDNNNWSDQFELAVYIGSLLGDSMIAGPFWNKKEKRIFFNTIKRPETVRVLWSNDNGDQIDGFIFHWRISLINAAEMFADVIKNKDILLTDDSGKPISSDKKTATEQFITLRQYWDDEMMGMWLGRNEIAVEKHDNGFVPLVFVPNILHHTRNWGVSDIENVLSPQVEYNESVSEERDILKQTAYPSIFGANLSLQEHSAGVTKIYDLGDEAQVFDNPLRSNLSQLEQYINQRRLDINQTSGLNDIITGAGGKNVATLSGRALSVLMQPINNRIRARSNRWKTQIKAMVSNILILAKKHITNASKIIDSNFKIDVFFPGTLVRDVVEELNKFQQKTQSLTTTQKNIGIASPKDEQKMMKQELDDQPLMIEFSRAPQLQLQRLAQAQEVLNNMINDSRQQQAGKPILQEGDNQEGDQLASAPGVPVQSPQSPEGAIAQNNQRNR